MATDEFWERVRLLLRSQERSQAWLARRLRGHNAKRQTLHAWMTGKVRTPPGVKRDVALILGLRPPDDDNGRKAA